MGKPKESTWLLKSTCAILCRPIKRIGQSTLQWASLNTILVSILRLSLHHSFWPWAGCQERQPSFINPEAWSTESKVLAANNFIKGRRSVIEAATKGFTLAQSLYKKQGDISRRQVCFEIGERVWL